MNWKNLKKQKCPKCEAHLIEANMYYCPNGDFMIAKGKMWDIIGKKPKNLGQQANELLRKIKNKNKLWNIPDNF